VQQRVQDEPVVRAAYQLRGVGANPPGAGSNQALVTPRSHTERNVQF